MQLPRNKRSLRAGRALTVSALALLGLRGIPAAAQEKATAALPADLVPVHLWVAGHTVPLRVSPVSNGQETYVPLTALSAVGAEFRLISDGNAIHVTARCRREQDIPLMRHDGTAMVALSTLAQVLDASVETSATESPTAKPALRSNDTVYLLAHVTDARYENGQLRVRTSFPVPFHSRMLAEVKPIRGYVDCEGAELPDDFKPTALKEGERQALRLRVGQSSPTIARVVLELAEGVSIPTSDIRVGRTEALISTIGSPAARVRETAGAEGTSRNSNVAAAGPQAPTTTPDHSEANTGPGGAPQSGDPASPPIPGVAPEPGASQSVTVKPAKPVAPQPIAVSAVDVIMDGPSVLRLEVATGARVRPTVRYTPGTTQMLVDIPNAVLALPEDDDHERSLKHPLISGVRMETIQGEKSPHTRLTLDTARILGYSLNIQQGSFSLELRVPRNATGALADKLIVVDAGHGGSATGATCAGICEKDCTLGIALKLRQELESCGARVIMTRTRDADVSLTDRSRMGNELGADLFVSIHNDSNERNNSASGTSTYFHNSDPSSRALATCVQHAVMAITGLPSRGVLSDTVMYQSGFAVLRGSSMPAVLCEVAYINNVNDRRKLIDGGFQQRVARALCDGLRNYVEGSPKRSAPAFARPMPKSGDDTDGAAGS